MFPQIKNGKSYIVKRISIEEDPQLKKTIEESFTNPNEFFNFYPLSKRVIFGSRPQGPRYDQNDVLVPYSIVGNPKYLRKGGKGNDSKNTSYFSQSKMIQTKEEKKQMNLITDAQLASIYSHCKEKIECNKTMNNEFLKTIPPIMTDKIQKPLLLQQRVLNDVTKNLSFRKKFEGKLAKSINRGEKDLLIARSDAFRMKKERMEFVMNNENYDLRYGMNSWMMGLRRPNNFVGLRKGFMNFGTDTAPFWGPVKEQMPIVTETITNPSCDNEKILYDSTIVTAYMNTCPNFKSQLEKKNDLLELKIEGKDLLQFEEENAKLVKGKKKLNIWKYNDEFTKSMKICEKWN